MVGGRPLAPQMEPMDAIQDFSLTGMDIACVRDTHDRQFFP
jgi:hypothetical protein